MLTLRQEDSQDEEVEEDRGLEEDEDEGGEGSLQQVTEVPSGELALLLAQSDILHTGGASLKAEGFRLLLDNRAEVRKTASTHISQKASAYSHKTIKGTYRHKRTWCRNQMTDEPHAAEMSWTLIIILRMSLAG